MGTEQSFTAKYLETGDSNSSPLTVAGDEIFVRIGATDADDRVAMSMPLFTGNCAAAAEANGSVGAWFDLDDARGEPVLIPECASLG